MTAAKKINHEKISIYSYHSYREFLTDWIAHLSATVGKVSARTISLSAGFSSMYLNKVLVGKRNLTPKALEAMRPHLKLNLEEHSFLLHLLEFCDSKSVVSRHLAYQKIQRFGNYRALNKSQLVAHQYWKQWYYPVIREMTALKNFQLDPHWIQKKLKFKVPITDVKECLNFLLKNNFIEFDDKGNIVAPEKHVHAVGGVHRLALSDYQEQIANLAVHSTFDTPREERKHATHTISIHDSEVSEVRKIIEEALSKIQNISNRKLRKSPERVMQVYLTAFPVTSKEDLDA